MARKSDHRADDLETDDTGGVLSGLLAEEEDLDRRALWRLGSWGAGAVAAVTVAAMANQTQFGWKRDQLASADLTRQTQQVQMAARETQNEARRLASAIDTLNSDRDRLYARVTGLEQGLDSVTGAIARQGSTPPAPSKPAPAAEPQAAQTPAPAVAPVATMQPGAPTPEKPAVTASSEPGPAAVSSIAKDSSKDSSRELAKTEIPKPENKKAEAAKSDSAKSDVAKVDIAKTSDVTPATPLVASQSFMAPPDPAAAKLTDPAKPLSAVTASPIPEVVASAPVSDADADEETAPKVAIQRTQFGVDLGTANSVPGLRALWRGLLKSKSNAQLAALRPIIVIKEPAKGLGMQLRLVAGPLNDAGAAAKICAVLAENRRNCETAIFDGQRLSVTGDEPAPPPASRPSQRRLGANKRATAVFEEPPKKPETSSTAAISSWFGKKGQ